MGRPRLNIVLLTSTRADYSIYLPLIKKLLSDSYFNLKIVAFGSHLSKKHGYTIQNLIDDGFTPDYQIKSFPKGDTPFAISSSMADTFKKFSALWNNIKEQTDLIIALGDRFEMFAAVSSSLPFNITIAHFYGGDMTVGSIDDVYRDSLSTMARIHFTSIISSAKRVRKISNSKNIYNVGSLSLDNLKELKLLSSNEFYKKFNIPIRTPILVTIHPETKGNINNRNLVKEIISAIEASTDQIIITLPNNDPGNEIIRNTLIEFGKSKDEVYVVESLGPIGYYSCLKHCKYVLGNSSSGIMEAASFGKYVINVGNRQTGRPIGKNVINTAVSRKEISDAIERIQKYKHPGKKNIYGTGNSAEKVVKVLKKINISSIG